MKNKKNKKKDSLVRYLYVMPLQHGLGVATVPFSVDKDTSPFDQAMDYMISNNLLKLEGKLFVEVGLDD